jgi:quinol monooxygenase YgiN
MLVVARLDPPTDEASFLAAMRAAMAALAGRPGHLSTRLARALDDESRWVLVSDWADVGSYRRALSSYDVRMAGAALMGAAVNEPSAYDVVASA